MDEQQMIYGVKPLLEAVQDDREFEKVFVSKDSKNPLLMELNALLREKNINHQHVPIQKLNRICKGNHQGAVGLISLVPRVDLYEFLNVELAKGTALKLLILDRITDVRNVGAISRSALAFGFHALIAPEKGSAILHADAIKASAGALLQIPLIRVMNLSTAMKDIKLHGIQLVGITEKTDKELHNLKWPPHVALVLGSEENGIAPENLKLCNSLAKVPMNSNLDSLNVSVAGAIAMYEVAKSKLTP